MNYRREIDGLRALAVLPVMLFHAGFETFSGGFVGVDVFFVISGYLITSIIIAELEQGRFSILDFYERRARRILPALFVVLAACLPPAWLWLLPLELEHFSRSLTAVPLFGSNILFWRTSGYFDTAAELKPLLHTWSLAVEEQYYLLFPPLLVLGWRLGRRGLLAAILGLAVFSLVVAERTLHQNPVAAFFLLPSRGWELLGGGFLALYQSSPRHRTPASTTGEVLALIGLAGLLVALCGYDRQTPFPGLFALLPVAGTMLMLCFATDATLVGRLLGSKALVGIGLLSYSAYLWHQPLLAFARHRSLHEPDKLQSGLLVIAALGLAYLSWRHVEKPFRNRDRFSRRQVFAFSIAGSLLFIALGVVGSIEEGFPARLPPNLSWQSLGNKMKSKGDVCKQKPLSGFDGVSACDFGDLDSSSTLILYGDSHAQAIGDELDRALRARKIKGIRVSLPGCQIIPQLYDTSRSKGLARACPESFTRLLAYIRSKKSDVIVASRWTFRLYPVPGEIEDMPYRNSEGGIEKESYREYALVSGTAGDEVAAQKHQALDAMIDGLLSAANRVFLIHPVPEIGWNIAQANFIHYRKTARLLEEISIPHADFTARNRFVNRLFREYEGRPGLIAIKPEQLFCNTEIRDRCVAQYRTVPYYLDDDHLADAGARKIVSELLQHLP